MKVKINTIFGVYICRSFTDVDPDISGLEISKNDCHIGSMIGANLPDEDDEDEIESFTKKLENWITENE